MLMTTGNGFDSYHVEKYLGIISKEIIFRSGLASSLGAAISNFVSAFNFRDVELTGSTDLIENAKNYLFEQFEAAARRKGANAVIGIDVETSFGTDVARVAISGTAVFIVKDSNANTSDSLAEGNTSNIYAISATNVSSPFLPLNIEIDSNAPHCMVGLEILMNESVEPGDISADLIVKNKFGDLIHLENICFIDMQKTIGKRYKSAFYPVSLPLHIACCIDSCQIVLRKYFINGELQVVDDTTLREVEVILDETPKGPDLETVIEQLSKNKSSKEMMLELDTMDLDHGSELYQAVYKVLNSCFQIERMYGVDYKGTMKKLRALLDQ